MGGEVDCESEPGNGATFRVVLPIDKQEIGKAPSMTEAAIDRALPREERETRILLAEDNPVNLELTRAMLKTLGMRVDTVLNGREAVVASRQKAYDLILMDCQMPVLDGFDAAWQIRIEEACREKGGNIPIIALTAHVLKSDQDRCLAAGMNDFLGKPFNQKQLNAVLERWLPSGASPKPSVPNT
jgi:CheY-like chemotaxis protein